MSEGTAKVIFQPEGKRGEVEKGISLIEASRRLGADIESVCGGKGVGGKCKVRVMEGHFSKMGVSSGKSHVSRWQEQEGRFNTEKEKKDGYRLACCAKVKGDLLVFVTEESRSGKQVVSKGGRDIPNNLNPGVKCYCVDLIPPTNRLAWASIICASVSTAWVANCGSIQ